MKTNVPVVPMPRTAADWNSTRNAIRATLETLLGELPPPVVPEVEILSRERRDGCICEHFRFHNGDPIGGAAAYVTGYLLIPEGLKAKAPTVQYLHWHGGEYALGKDIIWRKNSRDRTPADELLSRGCVVMATDTYAFGERSGKGPGGPDEIGSGEEMSLSKLNLWYGRTLWGMMLRDERLALDYLLTRPEVDSSRVGAMGISMGSTRTWWHMALDERVKLGVAVACLTRYQELIARGALRVHGIYYFVPGMLRHFDSEAVVSLVAPRPLLCLSGDQDNGTPPEGVAKINEVVAQIYNVLGAPERYRSIVYPNVGHEWTPTMWEETTTWLDRYLTGYSRK